jgi:hypothetical protein
MLSQDNERPLPIFGPAHSGLRAERGDISTFHRARKHSQATTRRSSTISPSNRLPAQTSLPPSGRTLQQATGAQPSRLCPNQAWSKHKLGMLADTRQDLALAQLSTPEAAVTQASGWRACGGGCQGTSPPNWDMLRAGTAPLLNANRLEGIGSCSIQHALRLQR